MIRELLISMRPRQWIKNGFVLAALVFVRAFNDPVKVSLAFQAVVLFCCASSAVYLMNDVLDAPRDRLHPTKKLRPIARGVLSAGAAIITAIIMGSVAVIGSFVISKPFAGLLVIYIILQILYSLILKKIVIIDVITLALGFVIRVIAGAVVINVSFSPWLIFCTFFLTLFLAITKRRSELAALGSDATRPVLDQYSLTFLGQMNMIVLPLTLMTYSLYTFSSEHSRFLMITVPIVLYGLFRYQLLANQTTFHGDGPTDVLWRDRALQITILVWIITSTAVIWFAK